MNKLYDIRNRFVFYSPREEMQIRGGIQKKKEVANFKHDLVSLFLGPRMDFYSEKLKYLPVVISIIIN